MRAKEAEIIKCVKFNEYQLHLECKCGSLAFLVRWEEYDIWRLKCDCCRMYYYGKKERMLYDVMGDFYEELYAR